MLSISLEKKVVNLVEKFEEVERTLSTESIHNDPKQLAQLNKEYSRLQQVVELFRDYNKSLDEIEQAESLLQDPEYKELAQTEIESAKAKIEAISQELKAELIPKIAKMMPVFLLKFVLLLVEMNRQFLQAI